MIYGLGIDLTDRSRIGASLDRFGQRFLNRVFTAGEQLAASKRSADRNTYLGTLAKRFAAKEAAGKALGTGVGQGIGWKDLEVTSTDLGAPQLLLHGPAMDRARALMPPGMVPVVYLALTDEGDLAMAQVILSAQLGPEI